MTDIPATLADVTADWLVAQMRAAGHDAPDIASFAQAPMDGFTGAMGEVSVIDITWAADTDLPTRFVAKCPLDDEIAQLYNSVMQFYVRECGFYADLATDVDMRIPRCFANRFDAETGQAFLLLEYLAADKGDILAGTSVETLRSLVGDLARMHGTFWMDERLLEIDWLMDWKAESFQLGVDMINGAWNDLAAKEPDRYPAEVAAVLKATFIENTLHWLDAYEARPWTLTHIDYELDNVLIDSDGPIVIDWQTTMRSHPGVDLAWLLAASHNDETLAAEPMLLDHYRAELAAAGGPSWSADELEVELCWGILYPAACQPVPYLQDTSAYGDGADRMHRRFEKFLQGSIDAAVRWNFVDHIGPLV